MAKAGALTGTFIFKPLSDSFGLATLLFVQVALSLLGMVVTHVFVDDDEAELCLSESDSESQTLRLVQTGRARDLDS